MKFPSQFVKSGLKALYTTFVVALAIFCANPSSAERRPASVPAADAVRPAPPTIVIGFMGGMVKHDEPLRSEVTLAARLRQEYSSAVDVETYENARRKAAKERILKLLDTNGDGTISPEEKQGARIILFGHSWGASAAVTLARELGEAGIPVLLTIQVDSVKKFSQQDDAIPANVAEAVNFYQTGGLLHGRQTIHAVDPNKTKILGNYRMDYKNSKLSCKGYPWHQRVFARTHMQIECDPGVWEPIETLIRSKLPQMQVQTQGN
jgi:hypothetical protein